MENCISHIYRKSNLSLDSPDTHTHRLVIGFGDILSRKEFSIAHIALLLMSPLSLRVNRSQFIVKSYSMGFKGVISINTRIGSLKDSLPHNGYNQFQPLENGYNQF